MRDCVCRYPGRTRKGSIDAIENREVKDREKI